MSTRRQFTIAVHYSFSVRGSDIVQGVFQMPLDSEVEANLMALQHPFCAR